MTRTAPLFAKTALAAVAFAGAAGLAACNRPQAVQAAQAAPMTAADGDPACPSIGTLAQTRGGPIALTGPTVARLAAVCSPRAMTEQLRTYGPSTRYLLVADDLRVGVQPGALFHLSFGAPTTGEPAVLGTLNFFAAQGFGAAGSPRSVSYDVTRQVREMAVSGWPANGLGVAIAPQGPLQPGAAPAIGAIRLVAQPPR